MSEAYRDAQKVLASLGIGFALPVLGIVALVAVAYSAGSCGAKHDATFDGKIDTVRITQQARSTAAETVTVKLKAKARVDTLVQTVTDTQLVVRETPASPPETVTVRPEIVQRIRVDARANVAQCLAC
jgi:hypothetical protein